MKYTYDDHCYSDLHKDAYGFRPRGSAWDNMTPDEKQAEWDYLLRAAERRYQEEQEMELAAISMFETRVKLLIKTGAGDRATAIRWLKEAEGPMEVEDECFFEYSQGLPYHYLRLGNPIRQAV